MALGRALIPVAYTRSGPFHQDPATGTVPLPGLAARLGLTTLAPSSEAACSARIGLAREDATAWEPRSPKPCATWRVVEEQSVTCPRLSRRALLAGLAASSFICKRARAAEISHVTWALPARIGKMDPVIADQIQTHAMSLTAETLMRFDDRGQPRPNLAHSVTQSDATTYVYSLRPDVRFWDGSALTAEDVVFSMQRQADPKTRGGWAAFYANVADIEVTSPLEVTIRLREPDPAWRFTTGARGAARVFSKAQAQSLKGEIGVPDAPARGRTLQMGKLHPRRSRRARAE